MFDTNYKNKNQTTNLKKLLHFELFEERNRNFNYFFNNKKS